MIFLKKRPHSLQRKLSSKIPVYMVALLLMRRGILAKIRFWYVVIFLNGAVNYDN